LSRPSKLVDQRQANPETSAFTHLRRNFEPAAEHTYVLPRLERTNTHALTALRTIEWPKQTLTDEFLRHAGAIIFYRNESVNIIPFDGDHD
jgi:hypothetical protein